jgi:5'-3' exonuclease
VVISTLLTQLGKHTNADIDETMLRHMILNTIRSNRKKFHSDYGELVLAADDKNYWRRKIFPYYKALRKQHRENSDINWKQIFETLELVKNEIRQNFPYKVIQVETAEADDVIASICMEYGQQLVSGEKFLIISADKDMTQLQKFANVDQWDPIRKRWMKNTDPDQNLFEHIVRGDGGDGIPNILSADDVFITKERQKSLTQKRIVELKKGINNFDNEVQRNFKRNQMLIDFDYIPPEIRTKVLEQYNTPKNVGREKLFNFFIEKRLRNLTEVIQDF